MTATINPAAYPLLMRDGRQWATHRAKVPYISGTERKAKSNDSTTWGSFDDARTAVEAGKASGLYYAMQAGSGIVGIDLDHCVTNGVVDPWAMVYVRLFNSYTCLSASLTGIRIFIKGTKPSTDCKRGPVECYDHDRFLSVTDQRVPGTPDIVEERQAELEAFHKLAFPPKPKPERKAAPATRSTSTVTITDDERFAAAMRNAEFARLHHGDISGYIGDSEARISYLNRAAFYSDKNAAAMERWIRASSLNPAKFDDSRGDTTFLATEIADACDYVTETYDPNYRSAEQGKAAVQAATEIIDEAKSRSDNVTPTTPADSGNDGAQGCSSCGPTFAQNADLLAANAELRASFTALANVLKIPNEALPAARKIVAIVATFELLSKESRAPGAPHHLYGSVVAEKAGVVLSTASDTLKMLSREVNIFERHEEWEKISPTTGEIFDPPRRVLDYRPRYPGAPATFKALVTAFAPKQCEKHPETEAALRCPECLAEAAPKPKPAPKPKLCKDHPEAGTVVRCAVCFASLPGGTPADPKRKRPSGLEDYMADQPPLPHCVVTTFLGSDLDQMADEPPSPRPERLVELGAALGYPALIVNRRVTIPEGQDAWQGFAAVANGTLAMAIAAAAAYEPSELADQMGGFTGSLPVGTSETAPDRIEDLQRRHRAPPSLDDEFDQIVRSAGDAS